MKRDRQFDIQQFEQEWTCPITTMPMKDPVVTIDGQSYEKESILKWIQNNKQHPISPRTGLELSSRDLIPNIALKNVIEKYKRQLKLEYQKLINQNGQLSNKISILTEKQTQYQKTLEQVKGVLQTVLDQNRQLQQKNKRLQLQNKILHDLIYSANSQINEAKSKNIKNQNEGLEQVQALDSTIFQSLWKKFLLLKPNSNAQRDKQIKSEEKLKKKQKIDEESLPAESRLRCLDYVNLFPVLFDSEKNDLDHSEFKIDVPFFLQHDWSKLCCLNLNNSQLDNEGLLLLLENGNEFKSLHTLSLSHNPIEKLPQFTFEMFGSIRRIYFSDPGKNSNLNSQSKRLLEELLKNDPSIQIRYESFHS